MQSEFANLRFASSVQGVLGVLESKEDSNGRPANKKAKITMGRTEEETAASCRRALGDYMVNAAKNEQRALAETPETNWQRALVIDRMDQAKHKRPQRVQGSRVDFVN